MSANTTLELCQNAYVIGALTFIPSPNGDGDTVCSIGDDWFYFADSRGVDTPVLRFISTVGHTCALAQVAAYIDNEMQSEFPNEYDYVMAYLQETNRFNTPQDAKANGYAVHSWNKQINDTTCNAQLFAWDNCHKIYIINTKDDYIKLENLNYTIYPIELLPNAWYHSCPLRFIAHADLQAPNLVCQLEPAHFEKFNIDEALNAKIVQLNQEINKSNTIDMPE